MLPHLPAKYLAAGLLLTGLFITPAFAVTGTVDTGGPVLRVRSEASVAGDILAKLSDGALPEVLSNVDDGAWYKISCGKGIGYVSGEYLKVNGAEAASLPEESAPIYVKVTTPVLNIRSGPGTNYDKTGKLRDGLYVKTTGQQGGWYKLSSGKGYISGEYVQEVSAEEVAKAAKETAKKNEVSSKGKELVNYALQFKGCRYVYGGTSPKGFDCSGLTKYVYGKFGYTINRTASAQLDNGKKVSKGELQPGDLVFFKQENNGKRASHVGIYVGGGKFLHASEPGVGVIVSSLSGSYYGRGYIGARRIV